MKRLRTNGVKSIITANLHTILVMTTQARKEIVFSSPGGALHQRRATLLVTHGYWKQ
jgi:hypothetical protein